MSDRGKGRKASGKGNVKRDRKVLCKRGERSKDLRKQDAKNHRKSHCGKGYKEPGKETAKGCPNCHKVHRGTKNNITSKVSLRCISRRVGIKKVSIQVLEESQSLVMDFIRNSIEDAAIFTELANRKTITAMDVVNGLKWRKNLNRRRVVVWHSRVHSQ
ncbi:Histone H4 like protein [Argiope bruennichi]|uniref:Histone H4 n=1 Tax=Argiope bruennichi TaxID=94029 RepID=A0A8T0FBH8_ARGBR|nr:Histone H4 like protein [Argiope bruennichi]